MTEFRTRGKGKDKQVYPVKKKPFGISRNLAYEEVQAMRQKGEKARLIKTNRRLDLYAPYVADINVPDLEPEHPQVAQTPNGTAGREHSHNPSRNTSVPVKNEAVVDRVKEAEKRYRLNSPTIMEVDGKDIVTVIDPSTIYMGWVDLPEKIPEASVKAFNDGNKTFRLPAMDYDGDGTASARLGVQERNNIRMLARTLVKEMNDDVRVSDGKKLHKYKLDDLRINFQKPDEGKYGYVVIRPDDSRWADDDKTYGHAMRVEMSGRTGLSAAYGLSPFLASVNLLNTLTGTQKGKKSRGDPYYATLKDDYPVTIAKESAVNRKLTDIPAGAMLAPLMEDASDRRNAREIIKKLTGEA